MTTGNLARAALLLFHSALCCCGYFDLLDPYELKPVDDSITWQAQLGGAGEDVACCVQQTADGGFILAGHTSSFGAGLSDLWLVKTDSAGAEQWSRTFGGTQEDRGHCLQRTSDGGYVLAGTTRSFGAGEDDVYLVKTDANGDLEWQKTFGGGESDEGYCVRCTSDGGYVVSGLSASFSMWTEVYLIKTDANGDAKWSKTYGGSYGDCGYCVHQTVDDGYIVAGLSQSEFESDPPNIEDNAYLLKTDAYGSKQWSECFGLEWLDIGTGCQLTADGGYILCGYTNSYGEGEFNALLVKTDSAGQEQWLTAYGGDAWDQAEDVLQTSDGGFLLVGMSRSWGPYEQAWLVKTDAEGIEQWNKHFGGMGMDWGLSVRQTSDGGYILAGKTDSFGAGDLDAYLVYYKP